MPAEVATTGWPGTGGHLAVTRQRCTTPGCCTTASSWCRCPRCMAVAARCGEHGGEAAALAARAACCGGVRR